MLLATQSAAEAERFLLRTPGTREAAIGDIECATVSFAGVGTPMIVKCVEGDSSACVWVGVDQLVS